MNLLSIDRVAFTIFGIEIMWYGVLIAVGMLLAVYVASKLYKNRDGNPDDILTIALIAIPLGVIGARLYFIAFTPGMGLDEFIYIRDGGLAIYGGIIGGIVGIVVYSLIKKLNLLTILDCIMPGVLIAQALGRWGNFFNQEAYGNVVTNPKLQFFPYAVYIDRIGEFRQATFFYESFLSVVGFILILLVLRKRLFKGSGLTSYLIWYGIERAIVEGFRDDSLYIGNSSIRVSQLLSIILIAFGIVLAIVLYNREKKLPKENKQENNKTKEKIKETKEKVEKKTKVVEEKTSNNKKPKQKPNNKNNKNNTNKTKGKKGK